MKTAPIARTEPVNCSTAKAHGAPKDAVTQQRNKLPCPKQGEVPLRGQDFENRYPLRECRYLHLPSL